MIFSFPGFLHAARVALLVAALSAAWTRAAASFESWVPRIPGTAPPKAALSPAVEAKLKEFLDKAKVVKRKAWELRMKKEIDDVAKATGLGEEGKKSLEAPAEQAVEASLDAWAAQLDKLIREQFSRMQTQERQILQNLDQMIPQAGAYAQTAFGGATIPPFEQEAWIKGVHQTLTSEQAATWDKAQADHKQEIEKQIAVLVKGNVDRLRQALKDDVLSKCQEMELSLALPKERADKLEELANKVTDQCAENAGKQSEKTLLSMSDEQRDRYVKAGRFYTGVQESDYPSKQSAWTEGVEKILTADEKKRLEALREEQKAKRAQALAGVMVMLMDEKLALTSSQREKLLPVAVKNLPQEFISADPSSRYNANLNPQELLAANRNGEESKIKPILDDIQWKRWQELEKPEDPPPDQPDDDKSNTEDTSEPEYVEKQISKYLYQKSESEEQTVLAVNTLKAEDAVRVAGLSAEVAARLQTAARGATEASLAGWKMSKEQTVRSQVQDATPQNVKQRLQNIQDYYVQRENEPESKGEGIWEKTVKQELTAQQQEAWRKETEARDAFHDKAITSVVLTQFDRKTALTAEQLAKLEPIVAKMVHDYSRDIAGEFSQDSGESSAWYLGYYSMIPFAGIPEADLKSILTTQQIGLWTVSPEYSYASQVWTYIDQNHKQRTGQAKQ